VLEAAAERACERAGELLRALDAIGEEAEDAAGFAVRRVSAVACHEGAGAGAHPLEAGLDLLEGAEAAALLGDLVTERGGGRRGLVELLAEALHFGFDGGAALGGVFFAASEALVASGQLLALLRGLGEARFELGPLHGEALAAARGLLATAERALQDRVGAHDARAHLARALAES